MDTHHYKERPKHINIPPSILLKIFLPFAAGYFLSYLYRTVNAVISADLLESLKLDASELGLLTSVYFLSFAGFQLPLGMLLDRFGPRRVEAFLLLFAASGATLFALSNALSGLVMGRALIGLGVSACLMGSFKAFTIWFPTQWLPVVNGWVMAAGGLGALTATAPVEIALGFTTWRELFLGLSLLTLAVSVVIFWIVPEPLGWRNTGESWRQQWRGVRTVFGNRLFWQVAPLTMLSQAAFQAIQGLWVGPWLRDVARIDRFALARHLFFLTAAMILGYLSMGNLAYRLSRIGIPPLGVAFAGMVIFIVVQLSLTLGFTQATLCLWVAFGFFGTAGILSYAALSQSFAAALAGRVNTALNLLVFLAAFIAQWGIGVVINPWQVAGGGYDPRGYQMAFGLLLVLQVLAVAWFLFTGSKEFRWFPRLDLYK